MGKKDLCKLCSLLLVFRESFLQGRKCVMTAIDLQHLLCFDILELISGKRFEVSLSLQSNITVCRDADRIASQFMGESYILYLSGKSLFDEIEKIFILFCFLLCISFFLF